MKKPFLDRKREFIDKIPRIRKAKDKRKSLPHFKYNVLRFPIRLQKLVKQCIRIIIPTDYKN